MIDSKIQYEWEIKKETLDFEIGKSERQLASVDKRLHTLKTDFYFYAGLVGGPLIVLGFLQLLSLLSTPVAFVLNIVEGIFSLLYMYSLPFTIYYLIRSILLNISNRYEPAVIPLPNIRKDIFQDAVPREKNYTIERKKLLAVLSKYYLYRSQLLQLGEDMEQDDFSKSLEELRAEYEKMPLYDDIRPANLLDDQTKKKARRWTFACCAALIILLLFMNESFIVKFFSLFD